MSTKPGYGRNDNCPCGSGKKYKKCCLGKYGKAGYHTISCYHDNPIAFAAQEGKDTSTFGPFECELRERGTGRKVYVLGVNYWNRGNFKRIANAILANKEYSEEFSKRDGTIGIAVYGTVESWNNDVIVMNISTVLHGLQLVRIKRQEEEATA